MLRCSAVLIGIAAALALGEVWLRARNAVPLERLGALPIYRADPQHGYALAPNLCVHMPGYGGPIEVCTDSSGRRIPSATRTAADAADGQGATAAPDGAPVRILVLGDSFAFGLGVAAQDSFAERLAQRWRQAGQATVVSNTAAPGYCPLDYRLLVESELAALAPDLVILAPYLGNDARDTLERTRIEYEVLAGRLIHFEIGRARWRRHLRFALISHSALWRSLRKAQGRLFPERPPTDPCSALAWDAGAAFELYRLPASERVESAWTLALAQLDALATACSAQPRARLVLFPIPAPLEYDPALGALLRGFCGWSAAEFDPAAPRERLLAWARSRGIPWIDPQPTLAAQCADPIAPKPYADAHLNALGHRLGADCLEAGLRALGGPGPR